MRLPLTNVTHAGTDTPSLSVAKQHVKAAELLPTAKGIAPSACVSVTIQGGEACINTPVGRKCISVPSSVPNGTVAQACADVCKKFGVPCGVEVTVEALGQTVASKSYGCC